MERLSFHFSLSCIGEGNGNPLQCSCLKNPRDRGAWWAFVYGVAQSRTRLKQLSSSSSSHHCLSKNQSAFHNLQTEEIKLENNNLHIVPVYSVIGTICVSIFDLHINSMKVYIIIMSNLKVNKLKHRRSNNFSNLYFSVPQQCLIHCNPVDSSTPGFPVLHQLPELAQTHVH